MINEVIYNHENKDEEINNIESLIYCSICHKKTFDIKSNNSKKNKVLDELMQLVDFSELIKKCGCKNNNEFIYSHKYCILIKILFYYETKCEKCKINYNVEIKKQFNKNKFIYLLVFFLIIYIIHLLVFLLSFFLLFINVIFKEKMKLNKFLTYKHLFIFFGIVLFIVNCLFLYFSILNNIKQFKINIYNYGIDILDAENENKKTEVNELLGEFLEWAHFQSQNHLINNINNKFWLNRINSSYLNDVKNIINDNNKDMGNNMNTIKIINIEDKDNEIKAMDDNVINNFNINNNKNNPNFLQINSFFNKPVEEINFSSNQSSKLNNDNNDNNENENENSNNNIIIHNNSNNFIRKKSKKGVYGSLKLNHSLNDFINININPAITNKNINININFSNEKNSQEGQFSSSKEFTLRSGRALRRNSKIGKTALIPKKLMMTNIITDQNIFKRKARQLKSIKIRNQLNLKNTQISGNIEEIDFSSIEEIRSGFSKVFKGSIDQRILSPKAESKFCNLKSKKSFKDVPLNISNSYIEEANISKEDNMRDSIKTNNTNKKVHFAG